MIYSQLLVTENNDDNSHSQTQDYCPNDVPDNHDIMMQPDNQNADQQDYQIHALSGIGTCHSKKKGRYTYTRMPYTSCIPVKNSHFS